MSYRPTTRNAARPFSDGPPTLLSLKVSGLTFSGRSPVIDVRFVRPDQKQLILYSSLVPGPTAGEGLPLNRYHETPFRVKLSSGSSARASVADFGHSSLGLDLDTHEVSLLEETLDGATL